MEKNDRPLTLAQLQALCIEQERALIAVGKELDAYKAQNEAILTIRNFANAPLKKIFIG